MKTRKLIAWGKGLAIAVLVLGLIHLIATFTPLILEGLACLDEENLNAMIYMSLICGASLILAGWLLNVLLKRLEEHRFLMVPILGLGGFLALNGVLSVYYMLNNPFAWLAFLLTVAVLIVVLTLGRARD